MICSWLHLLKSWSLLKTPGGSLWGISTVSNQGVDAADPLHDRFIRYWPWPFGNQAKGIAVQDIIDASATAQRYQASALAESQRLLYVSMTRAREMLVLALKQRAKSQQWMDSLDAPWLLEGAPGTFQTRLPSGKYVPSQVMTMEPPELHAPPQADPTPLYWPCPEPVADKLPLVFNPSSMGAIKGKVIDKVHWGAHIQIKTGADSSLLGSAVHACLATSFAEQSTRLSDAVLSRVLDGFQVRAHIDAEALNTQIQTLHAWLQSRWPGSKARAEVPVKARMPNGQMLNGRIDLLLETERGFVLIDHKSSPLGEDKWAQLVNAYQGQLQAYAQALETATAKHVIEQWLFFPVAGGAVRCG